MATLTIPDHYQIKYSAGWEHLAQQSTNRLKPYVSVMEGCTGKLVTFDQISSLTFNPITTRMGTTNIDEIDTAKRSLRPQYYDKTVGFDEFDEQLLAAQSLPTSETMQSLMKGAERTMEQVIIDGIDGTNYTGEDSLTATTLPSGQQVAVDYTPGGGGSNSGLTLDKMIRTREIFQVNEVWGQDTDGVDPGAVFAVSTKQLSNLLRLEKATSSDYVGQIQRLVSGEVDNFLGFKILRTEQLPVASDVRSCLAWVKSGAKLGVWQNPTIRLSIRDDRNETLQIRAKFGLGATRTQEEKVVRVYADETTAA